MRPNTYLSSAALAILSQAIPVLSQLPTPPLPPWYPLQPWSITSFSASHPLREPYGLDSTSLNLTIANPSFIPAGPAPHASGGGYVAFANSSADCLIHWKTDAETPYGYTGPQTCSTEADYQPPTWKMGIQQLFNRPGEEGQFMDLSFELTNNMTAYGSVMYKLLTGYVHLEVGQNLEISCDAEEEEDARCVYALRDGIAPLLIQPKLQECKQACG